LNVEKPEPGSKRRCRAPAHAGEIAEIHNMDASVGGQRPTCSVKRLFPLRNHGQAVREDDPVERPAIAEQSWLKALGEAMRQLDAAAHAGPIDRLTRCFEHFRGSIEAEELGPRIAPGDGDQIARRAAADLDQAFARPKIEFADQPVAPKEIIFSSEIIRIALVPIDSVQHRLMRFGRRR